MKKLKIVLAVFIVFVLSSFCHIDGIYGYMTVTVTHTNQISLSNKTSYTVIHEKMDLNGITYTQHSSQTFNNIPFGTTVSPEVLSFTGFDSPARQTVTLNTYANTIIRYQYNRKSYNLTINNSNHVTTVTPSGSYLYGTQIRLIADQDDGNGSPFLKWSNDETNRDYTFTMTSDVTIGPIYANTHKVTYEPNNGDSATIRYVQDGHSIGLFPNVENNDCVGTTGTYAQRGCTYYYELLGWYSDSNFQNQVDETYVPTGNVTLYAKWNKVYFAEDGPVTFDGTNFIDTQMQLFNAENAEKDFIVSFVVDANNGYTNDRGAIFANMREGSEPFPGLQFFYNNNYVMNANCLGHKKKTNVTFSTGQKMTIKRESGVISYSINDGAFVVYNDLSSFNQYFNINATFGAEYDNNGSPYRYFKGTLSDMSVEIIDLDSYTVHFDANGGTGTMNDQNIPLGKSVKLNANLYSNNGELFAGWNTAADGSGTAYSDKQTVTNLGNKDDVITLYAQWLTNINYTVHFDANGGTGSMNDQAFTYGDPPVALTQNAFTKTGYQFMGWNTAADGSGTSYSDEELVSDLTNINNSVVTLYAQYMRIAYNYSGDYTFNGISDFIDTGVNLYSSTTMDKDFEIRFTVTSVAPDVLNQSQPTMINCKDESNPKWPGFYVRFNNNSATNMIPAYKWDNTNSSTNITSISTNNLPVEIVFKRHNEVVYFSYSYAGFESQVYTLYNQNDWQLTQYFTDNVSFGGIYDSSHNPDRFFKGTLSDMTILLDD